jgi:hypothetical protein
MARPLLWPGTPQLATFGLLADRPPPGEQTFFMPYRTTDPGPVLLFLCVEAPPGGVFEWIQLVTSPASSSPAPLAETLAADFSTASAVIVLSIPITTTGGAIDVTATIDAWNETTAAVGLVIGLDGSPIGASGAQMTPLHDTVGTPTVGSVASVFRIPAPPAGAHTVDLFLVTGPGGTAHVDPVGAAHGASGAWLRVQEILP